MKRRKFLQTSAGLLAVAVSPGLWQCAKPESNVQNIDFEILTEKFLGSGHPSIEPEGRYIVSDTYVRDPWPDDKGEVPLRLIDLSAEEEWEVARLNTFGENRGSLRVDPHPAWSRDYKSVCFNAVSDGNRQVYIADLSDVI